MKIDAEVLLKAVDALHAVERENERIEMTSQGGASPTYTIRDKSRPPMHDILWTGHSYEEASIEFNVIKDARRVTVVARVVADYERRRVWAAAVQAVENATLPTNTEGIPKVVQALLDTQTPAQAAIAGGRLQRTFDAAAVREAAAEDLDE